MEYILEVLAHDHADNQALIENGDGVNSITYASLLAEVKQLQNDFTQHGVTSGSVVSLAFPNSLELALVFLALLSQGATVAPLNPKFKAAEFEYYLEDSSADFLVAPPEALDSKGALATALDKLHCRTLLCEHVGSHFRILRSQASQAHSGPSDSKNHEDVALILHTSGTTGKPKRVPLSLDNLFASTQNVIDAYRLGRADRTVLLMPLFHIHGIVAGFLAPLLCGAGVVIPTKGLSNDFWRIFTDHEATWWTATPTHQKMILGMPPPLAGTTKLRFIRSCSSALSPQDLLRLENTFQVPVLQAYAMTENAHHIASHVMDRPRKPGSVGYPAPSVEVIIVDENGNALKYGQTGEIAIKGKSTTSGYLGDAEANAKAFTRSGHFRTGDIGSLDQDGCLSLTGRSNEMINKGGESLSPVEIDNVLSTHEYVDEAVSFAVPDEVYGEDIGAALVLAKGKSLAESELIHWLKDKVSETKVPGSIWFVDAIPKTATGKLQRLTVAQEMLKQGQNATGNVPHESGDPLEELRQMWSEILRVPAPEIKDGDSFTARSGNSGLAVRLFDTARKSGYSLSVAQIFAHDDLVTMAAQMQKVRPDVETSPNVDFSKTDDHVRNNCADALSMPATDIEDAYPMTPTQARMVTANLENGGYVATMTWRCPVALLPQIKEVMALIQQRHAILRAHTLRIDDCFYQAVTPGASTWENIPDLKTHLAQLRGMGSVLPLGERALRLGEAVEDDTGYFVLTLSHVIFDEWTRPLLFGELQRGLEDINSLRGSPIPSSSFGTFARYTTSLKEVDSSVPATAQLPHDPSSMKRLEKSAKLGSERRKYPWSVYAHLAWALTLASQQSPPSQSVTISSVNSGRTVPIESVSEILGPTLTVIPLQLSLSDSLPQSLQHTADLILGDLSIHYSDQKVHDWLFNCTTQHFLYSLRQIGPHLTLDTTKFVAHFPMSNLSLRAWKQQKDDVSLILQYDCRVVKDDVATKVMEIFAKTLSRISNPGFTTLGDIRSDSTCLKDGGSLPKL